MGFKSLHRPKGCGAGTFRGLPTTHWVSQRLSNCDVALPSGMPSRDGLTLLLLTAAGLHQVHSTGL